jgi:hypothetical protein
VILQVLAENPFSFVLRDHERKAEWAIISGQSKMHDAFAVGVDAAALGLVAAVDECLSKTERGEQF